MLYCKDLIISSDDGTVQADKINECVDSLANHNPGLSVVDIQILVIAQAAHAFIFYRHSSVAE